ncbi:MAG: NUDIX domain-containing protein [Clostridiales Family XIII bacterium]|jgi:ADP-ribose pyrophosphatase YjhB (NUDIX family)|nr:NUDIX domain-containing protein [Clostridiales Family XIII bacterium]
MWFGGVRVIILDEEGRVLLVRQHHEDKDIWMLPGGAIEDGENAAEAAAREVREETSLEIEVGDMLWHVEEVSKTRGQRFVNIFMAQTAVGEAALGSDPEFDGTHQVLREMRYFARNEIAKLEHVYPDALRGDMWKVMGKKYTGHKVFRIR